MKHISSVTTIAVLVVAGILGYSFLQTGLTLRDLFLENQRLKTALSNLKQEEQIGYAKVVDQSEQDGKFFTTLRFVETDRDDPTKRVSDQEFTIEGDVVHFDALIVKFDNELVEDGKARALFLWRRVYGEFMSPSEGYPIEIHGKEPPRYEKVFAVLKPKERDLFWAEVWDLAHDRESLSEYGVQAVYGNAVYTQLRPGLVYIFKVDATGQVYPEVIPDF